MCEHLIGRQYVYGDTDCIHLVVDALAAMGMSPPAVSENWYNLSPRQILLELRKHCDRVDCPSYDGDIILFGANPPEFGIRWQNGILFISHFISAVDWKPVDRFTIRRSYRMKSR